MSNNNTASFEAQVINYKVQANTTFSTTSTFFEADDSPLDLSIYDVFFNVITIDRSRTNVLSLSNLSGLIISENNSTISQNINLETGKYLYKYTISDNGFSAVIQKGTFEVLDVSLEENENEDQHNCNTDNIFGPISAIITLGYLVQSGGDKHYTHIQSLTDSTWEVNHNLNKYPSIEVVNSAHENIITNIEHINKNKFILYFNNPESGKVFCN